MAVYTEVSTSEVRSLLRKLRIGELMAMQGCSGGIENTNYFVSTEKDGAKHDYVLTLFERLSFEQLPFYLGLMKHLAQRGIPVPEPSATAQGELLFELKGKPAAVVNKLRGKSVLAPTAAHCAAIGSVLARMHLAGADFPLSQPNLRGLAWWIETVPIVLPHLDTRQATLIQRELEYQKKIAASGVYAALPRGPIHADIFRDNVMFDEVDSRLDLTGIFDFYFAGVDCWLFDIAVCMNDWCVNLDTGALDQERALSFLAAYRAERPLTDPECELFTAMLRAAALRFWISRLWDYHQPRTASLLKAHDPGHFERVLRQRVDHPVPIGALKP
jgi:homoserine kinase type II